MAYTLYSFWQSSSAWRVRIALNVKHIPYIYKSVDLLNKSEVTQSLSNKNPLFQVPVLETPSIRLTQSLAIFKYLEAKHKSPSMVPENIELEAKMWEVCEIINSGIQPLQNLALLKKIKSLGGDSKEWGKEVVEKGFVAIESVLKDIRNTFCVGESISFADACLLPQINNARRYGVELEKFEIIMNIARNLEEVEEIKKSLPENQPDAVLQKEGKK